MAVGHHQRLQPHHLGTTSIPQCPCSWWADACVRPPELHPNSLQRPPQGSLCPPEEEDGQAQALSHPQGASGLRSRSGISAGSGRNVVAAGTMPAPCTGPLRDSTGAAAQAQPCSQGAGRKQMEMTPAAISCGRTRGLSPPPLPLLAQQGLGHHRHHCSGLPKPCATQGTSTLLHPAPWLDRCHLHPGVAHATTRCRTAPARGCPVSAHQGCTQELSQQEPAPWDPRPLAPAVPSMLLEWLGESPALGCPRVGLELWTGLRGGAELPEVGQARPAQPPGLAQWRFIWNEWFPNKLCNLKILRKRKRQKGGEPTAAQPVHGDRRATRHPGLSPGTGRGSATAAPSPWLWPPAPEATWPHRPLSVSGGQATLVPSVTSPRAVSSASCL